MQIWWELFAEVVEGRNLVSDAEIDQMSFVRGFYLLPVPDNDLNAEGINDLAPSLKW